MEAQVRDGEDDRAGVRGRRPCRGGQGVLFLLEIGCIKSRHASRAEKEVVRCLQHKCGVTSPTCHPQRRRNGVAGETPRRQQDHALRVEHAASRARTAPGLAHPDREEPSYRAGSSAASCCLASPVHGRCGANAGMIHGSIKSPGERVRETLPIFSREPVSPSNRWYDEVQDCRACLPPLPGVRPRSPCDIREIDGLISIFAVVLSRDPDSGRVWCGRSVPGECTYRIPSPRGCRGFLARGINLLDELEMCGLWLWEKSCSESW